jgi:hypothetical protein
MCWGWEFERQQVRLENDAYLCEISAVDLTVGHLKLVVLMCGKWVARDCPKVVVVGRGNAEGGKDCHEYIPLEERARRWLLPNFYSHGNQQSLMQILRLGKHEDAPPGITLDSRTEPWNEHYRLVFPASTSK